MAYIDHSLYTYKCQLPWTVSTGDNDSSSNTVRYTILFTYIYVYTLYVSDPYACIEQKTKKKKQ